MADFYDVSKNIRIECNNYSTGKSGKIQPINILLQSNEAKCLECDESHASVEIKLNHNEIIPLITSLQKVADNLGLTF